MKKLINFFEENCINQSAFAKKINITPRYLITILKGRRPSLKVGLNIEKATNGKVSITDLGFSKEGDNLLKDKPKDIAHSDPVICDIYERLELLEKKFENNQKDNQKILAVEELIAKGFELYSEKNK